MKYQTFIQTFAASAKPAGDTMSPIDLQDREKPDIIGYAWDRTPILAPSVPPKHLDEALIREEARQTADADNEEERKAS
ncbi:MAG: hypothetical protein AAF618_03350 [Pseudomonadota bacterium]